MFLFAEGIGWNIAARVNRDDVAYLGAFAVGGASALGYWAAIRRLTTLDPTADTPAQ